MAKLFLLIKRRNAKSFIGAIPAKKGVSVSKLMATAKKQIKKGFTFKIITETYLKKKFSKLINKKNKKRGKKLNVRKK